MGLFLLKEIKQKVQDLKPPERDVHRIVFDETADVGMLPTRSIALEGRGGKSFTKKEDTHWQKTSYHGNILFSTRQKRKTLNLQNSTCRDPFKKNWRHLNAL